MWQLGPPPRRLSGGAKHFEKLSRLTIAWLPALHIAADRLHDGECRLDDVGATQSSAQQIGDAQFMNRERFLQAFLQAPLKSGRERVFGDNLSK